MQELEAYQWMKRYGYLPEVPLGDIVRLDTESVVTKTSLRLTQSAVYDVEQVGYADGVLGPRTMAMMTQPRCAHPDFADDELAKAEKTRIAKALSVSVEEAGDIKAMHAALADRAIGSGSWPMPCQKEGTYVNWDTTNAPRGLATDRLFEIVAKAYRDIGWNPVRRTSQNDPTNIRVTWEVLRGSTIGLAQFNSRSCRSNVFCKLDPGYNQNFWQVCGLLQHEMGHNCNLEHTRGGVMNPSITRFGDPIQWSRSDPSFRTLQRFFGGEPIDPGKPDPDPAPGPSGKARGFVTYENGEFYEIELTHKKA